MKSAFILFIFLNICLPLCYSQETINPEAVPIINTDNHGFQPDGSMDLTFAKSAQQKNQFIENAGRVEPGTNFLQHLFQTDGDDEFHFTLPVEQQIAFYVYAYVVEGNQYIRVKDVSTESPVRLFVLQGSDMIVKSNFFFQNYIVFNGKKGIKYTIKVQTNQNKKLLSLSLKLFIQEADISRNLKKKQTQKYSIQTQSLKSQLSQVANKFGVYWIIDQNNMRHSVNNIRRYLMTQFLQMALFAIASYVQITTLFKLLKTNQIIV